MLKKTKEIGKYFSKVSLKDENLLKSYSSFIAVFSSLITLISFFISIPNGYLCRIISSILFLLFLLFIFIYKWYKANQTNEAHLKINGTNVNVYIGDLFSQKGLKIIGVNNYIDLVVDDIVVSTKTLHGQFIKQHLNEINKIQKSIANSETLIIDPIPEKSDKISYAYGSCIIYNDYVLTVLTKFNKLNKAYTSIQEYIQFWMTFWTNIDILYNSKTINIPIMGAGQTRFRGTKPDKQELLEIALWTLKESGFCNTYPDRFINFVIYEKDASDIDFYRIQKKFK